MTRTTAAPISHSHALSGANPHSQDASALGMVVLAVVLFAIVIVLVRRDEQEGEWD